MDESEFVLLAKQAFGSGYYRSVVNEQALSDFSSLTAAEAISAGMDIREVWKSLCLQMAVPESLWWLADTKKS